MCCPAKGLVHHAVRQLADQAVQHGPAGVDIREGYLLWLARPVRRGNGEQLHCRIDHPGGGALHRDGLRLELSHRRRRALHVGAGRDKRSHHGLRLCANRYVSVGVSGVHIPGKVLFISVLVFIVIPLAAGWVSRNALIKTKGIAWFDSIFLPKFRPVTIVALLATLVLIFAFQAENIIRNWIAVLLLAIPILIQVYFNSSLTYLLMRLFKVRHNVATPGALIGASNFFELAVAVAITLFGPTSPALLPLSLACS